MARKYLLKSTTFVHHSCYHCGSPNSSCFCTVITSKCRLWPFCESVPIYCLPTREKLLLWILTSVFASIPTTKRTVFYQWHRHWYFSDTRAKSQRLASIKWRSTRSLPWEPGVTSTFQFAARLRGKADHKGKSIIVELPEGKSIPQSLFSLELCPTPWHDAWTFACQQYKCLMNTVTSLMDLVC